MDELELKRAINKGDKAQKLLDSTKELFDGIEADIWKKWKESPAKDTEGRENLYIEQHAIRVIQDRIKAITKEGKKAEEELKHKKVKHGNRNST